MKVTHTIKSLREALEGTTCVGFVPTMGALHAGHMSLVERAVKENSTVVVSIFVNPTQFNDKNDLKTYPRTPENDLSLLEQAGVDIVFMPSADEMYPEPDTRVFYFGQIDKVMEGPSRPGHFNGVAQIVSKLFDIVEPERAYFGEKDFQQIAVIRSMVRTLGYDIEIVPCPIVRESDGLAMSSRNLLLTPAHRAAAPAIYRTLRDAAENKGSRSVRETIETVVNAINSDPLLTVEYFNIVDAHTLQDVDSWNTGRPIQGCIVVRAGDVRLIDNIQL